MSINSWITRTAPGCSRCQGWGRSCCRPCPRPSPPNPLWSHLLLVYWCLGVNCPPQAERLWFNPPGSLGNWSHPLPLVSAWSAVDYSQRAAAALSSLDQLSAELCCYCKYQDKCIPRKSVIISASKLLAWNIMWSPADMAQTVDMKRSVCTNTRKI